MEYSKLFTYDDLNNIVNSGKNTVVSYPAGTGKTSAIVKYLCKNVILANRKIIYIAPSISLLDDMYENLIKSGVREDLIFNYHSKSKSYLNYLSRFNTEPEESLVNSLINKAKIILITHKRIMFESAKRFLSYIDLISDKPLVFIDEAVEPCLIAKIPKDTIKMWLYTSRIVGLNEDITNFNTSLIYDESTNKYVESPGAIKYNSRKLANFLTDRRCQLPSSKDSGLLN